MKSRLMILFILLNFLSCISAQQKPASNVIPGKYFLNQLNHHTPKEINGVVIASQINPNAINKNANSAVQSLLVDSVYIYNSKGNQREVYTYNSSGLITEDLIQQFSGNQWVNYQKVSNSYDAGGKVLLSTQANWENNTWVVQLSSTLTYNVQGQLIKEVVEQAINDVLINNSQYVYEYGTDSFLTSGTYQEWKNGQWVNNLKDTYTNDNEGNRLTDLMQAWQNSTWKDSMRFTLTYDNNSNNISEFGEIWTGQWENFDRGSNTYDSNNNVVGGLYERWENNAWTNILRNTFTYDSRNNRLQETDELFYNNQWNNQSRLTWTYDNNNIVLSELIELTGPTGDWSNNNKMEYNYDLTNNTATGTYYDWVVSSWVQSDGSLYFYDSARNLFVYNGNKVTVKFISSIMAVADKIKSPNQFFLSQNYPNPFNPSTVISYQLPVNGYVSLKIYNIVGKEISTLVNEEKQPGNYEITFDASKLSSGIYFYTLSVGSFGQVGSFVETKKMILIK